MSACPICKSAAPRAPENPSAPFCSERCRTIDLANWIVGGYRLDEDAPPVQPLKRRTNGSQP